MWHNFKFDSVKSFAVQVKSLNTSHNHFKQKKNTPRLGSLGKDAVFISIEVGSFKSFQKEIVSTGILNELCLYC